MWDLSKIVITPEILSLISEIDSQILQLVKENGRLSIKEIEALTGANRNTLKKHLVGLREKGFIQLHGKGRAVWYTL